MPAPSLASAAIALSFLVFVMPADAKMLIGSGTQGHYNNGIGDLATDPFMNDARANGSDGGVRMFSKASHSQGDPTATFSKAPDFSAAGAGIRAALGKWLTNPVAPGGSWTGPQAIPATWATNSETAIVYVLSSTAGIDNVVASIGVDNGVFVWLNGIYRFGATAPGGAHEGEYKVHLGNLPAGTHYLQILRTDHGGFTDWSIIVNGDLRPGSAGKMRVPNRPEPRDAGGGGLTR